MTRGETSSFTILKFVIFPLFAVFLFQNYSWSQQVKTTRDIGIWFNIGADYKFNKDWEAGVQTSVRTYDNALNIKKTLADFDMNYRINRNFKLGAGLRYDYARKKDLDFTHDIRYNLDLKFKIDLTERFELNYRLRYQHRYINLFTYHTEIDQNSNLRNRLKLEYEVDETSIYAYSEVFRALEYYKKPAFNALRVGLGSEFETGLGDFDYSLVYERELNDPHPLHFFFLNLSYTFKFKHA